MKIVNYFSPNFERKKRSVNLIKAIIIHYTGMQSERESLDRLCNPKSKVSSHFVINRKGKVYRLVKDNRTNHESPNPDKILDGDLDEFLESNLYNIND